MEKPSVQIIIINWNGLADTIACLDSLKLITYPNYKIALVDNGSKNNEAQQLEKKYGDYIQVIKQPTNLGFTGANNHALKLATSDYYLLLNNDTLVQPDFLDALIKELENYPGAGIAGSHILNMDGSSQSAGARVNLWIGSTSLITHSTNQNTHPVDMVSGCCFLIKNQVLTTIGLLDDRYFAYFEESDFCVRAKKAGFLTIMVPASTIKHKGGGSVHQISGFHERQLIRNRFLFIGINGSVLQKLSLFIYICLFYLWFRSFKIVLQKKKNLLLPLWQGLAEGLPFLFN